jgi:hypothetical protein
MMYDEVYLSIGVGKGNGWSPGRGDINVHDGWPTTE